MIRFLLVPVIMGCALGGTVGMLKLIGRITDPDSDKPEHK